MKRFLKKGMAALLSVVMVVTAAPQLAKEVHAAENQLPTKEQFATVEELKSFNTISSDNVPAAKVFFRRQRSAMVDCRKSAGTRIDLVCGKSFSNRSAV